MLDDDLSSHSSHDEEHEEVSGKDVGKPVGNGAISLVVEEGEGRPLVSGAMSPVGGSPHRCWLCEGAHLEADCEWYSILFAGTAPVLENPGLLRPMGHVADQANSVILETKSVQCKDVPSDGACLFHALGQEIAGAFRGAKLASSAQAWREMLLAYVLPTTDCMGGTPVQDWVSLVSGMDVGAYVAQIHPAAWGGFWR